MASRCSATSDAPSAAEHVTTDGFIRHVEEWHDVTDRLGGMSVVDIDNVSGLLRAIALPFARDGDHESDDVYADREYVLQAAKSLAHHHQAAVDLIVAFMPEKLGQYERLAADTEVVRRLVQLHAEPSLWSRPRLDGLYRVLRIFQQRDLDGRM